MSRRLACLAACAVLAAPVCGFAQGRPLTLESMNQGITVGDPQVSPDGARIAFVSNKSGRGKIWLVGIDGRDPKVLIDDAGSENSPRWSPDGKTLAFARAEKGQADIWAVTVANGQVRRITNDAPGERDFAWSPDGARLAFISDRAKFEDLYLVTVADGKVEQLTTETNPWDEGRWEPCWSPDGKTIAYVSNRSATFADDLWLVDVATKKTQRVTTDLHVMSTPIWSPDGRHIAFNGMRVDEFWYGDMSDIYLVAMPDRRVVKLPSTTPVSDGNGNQKMVWAADSKSLFFRYQWQGNTNLWRVGLPGDPRAESSVATQMTYEEGVIGAFTVGNDGKSLAYVRSSGTSGGDLYAFNPAGGLPRQLTNWFEPYAGLAAPERLAYRSTDGQYILGYLYRPPNFDASRKYPALVQVHGGGNNAHNNGFHVLENFLASQGFVVMAVEYRGSAGHGRAFQDLALGEWAAGQGWDAVAAARYLKAQPWSNGKVGIYGGSYGGIMSMAAVTRDSSAFDAAAPLYGIYDWADAYAHADRLMQFWVIEGHFGFKPGENPELFNHTASIKHLDGVSKTLPFLVMHGERDRRAPYQQSVKLVEALKARGNPVEFKSFPDDAHGFRTPKSRVDAYGRLLAFFRQHLTGGATGP